MLQLLKDQGPGDRGQMIPKLIGETTKRTPRGLRRAAALYHCEPADAIGGAINAMMTRPTDPLLASIHVPTLIIVGAEDMLTTAARPERFHGPAVRAIRTTLLPRHASAGARNRSAPTRKRPSMTRERAHELAEQRAHGNAGYWWEGPRQALVSITSGLPPSGVWRAGGERW